MNALVCVDVQNDFVTGPLGSERARKVAPAIIEYAKMCRNNGYAIFATVDTHKPTVWSEGEGDKKPIGGYLASREGRKLPKEHCIEGTEGHKIVQGLVKGDCGDIIIPQGRIVDKETFGSTSLAVKFFEHFGYDGKGGLLGEPLDRIFICGFATSICVMSNFQLLRTVFPEIEITVIENLCADIDEESHKSAICVMKNCQADIESVPESFFK